MNQIGTFFSVFAWDLSPSSFSQVWDTDFATKLYQDLRG